MPIDLAAPSAEPAVYLDECAGGNSEPAIVVQNLGKCYRIYNRPQDRLKQALFGNRHQYFREFWAVRDVSFTVHRGETVGIVGRNGCGKSTLLQMICGTLMPNQGKISVHGRIAALLELGAGFNTEFTGRDNIYTNAAILGLNRDEIDACYADIVDFSELGDFIDQPVKTYSSGMYVRLAFAVAISVNPDILIVDEALSVGDEAFQRKCIARIQAIQKRGGTILFVSHSAGTVIDLCSRALLLDQGELLTSGHPKQVVAKYHKLLYSPSSQCDSVRREIKEQPAVSAAADTIASGSESPSGTSQAYLEPELKPKSTVIYEANGAEITDPRITTPAGHRVNVLVPHEEYLIRYRVAFSRSSFQVRCGTMIKNTLGTELGGMNNRSPVDHVTAGTEVELAFRFRCQLIPGVYFANVGLMGAIDGRYTFLHRMEDALMFRVIHGNNHSLVGPVDFFLESQLQFTMPSEGRKAA